jgi:hypothetical protein
MEAILEVYATIFRTFTFNQLLPSVSHIANPVTVASSPTTSSIVCTLHKDPAHRFSLGHSCLPANAPSIVQDAYLNLDLCDFALEAMIWPISARLRTVGARVDWLLVTPAPLLFIHFHGEKVERATHSVMSITSENGEQYIVDFTVQQFGYPAGCWIMDREDYLEACTADKSWQLAEEEDFGVEGVDTGVEGGEGGTMAKWRSAVRNMCLELDWYELDGLERKERIEIVRARAEDSFAAIGGEMLGEL